MPRAQLGLAREGEAISHWAQAPRRPHALGSGVRGVQLLTHQLCDPGDCSVSLGLGPPPDRTVSQRV